MRTVLKLTAVAALAACATGAAARTGAAQGPDPWVERELFVMGTFLRIAVEAVDRARGLEAIEAAFAEVRRLDGVLSSWRADSEIARVNAARVGEPVPVSEELWALLLGAKRTSEETAGAFDPGVGALVDAWDARGAGRRPSPAELAVALEATGIAHFAFDPAGRTVKRDAAGAWLDTGGFGKGAALDAAARALRSAGVRSAVLDFGGQILAMGPEEREIAIAHPSRRSESAGALRLREGSVSTTSQSERWVSVAGERLGHVLDPRTGAPVPAWGSVTVVARDALTADLLSTALFVLGAEEGRALADGFEEVGVLFLEERDGRVWASSNAAFGRYGSIHDEQRTEE